MPNRRAVARAKARELLARSGVKAAPVPVERIATELGAEITRASAEDDLSGFLLRDATINRKVIGVNATHSHTRQRFTIAHEIGHLVLHSSEPIHVDKAGSFRIERRNSKSSRGDEPREIEANAFAAELLMPAELLRSDIEGGDESVTLGDDSDIARLAEKYQVSTTAMTFRLANLGFISL